MSFYTLSERSDLFNIYKAILDISDVFARPHVGVERVAFKFAYK